MSRRHKVKSDKRKISWFSVPRIWVSLIVLILIANLALVYGYFFYTPSSDESDTQGFVDVVPPEGEKSRLSGELESEVVSTSRPFAVVLDNYSTARPQSGISDAVVVFEILVEGGVTRLLAVFQSDTDSPIGPVRSAREYMLPLVQAIDAVFGHSGGSIMALQELRESNIADADEFKYSNAYYRDARRFAPHNLFTTLKRLESVVVEKAWQDWNMSTQWQFSEVVPSGQSASQIDIQFSTGPYNTRWSYDASLGTYQRAVGGKSAVDANTKVVVSTKNLAVLYTTVAPAPRLNYPDAVTVDTSGSGEAVFFRNGVAIIGRWSLTERGGLTLLNENGLPYNLSPGNTWFSFVSADIPDIVSFE